MCSNGYSLWPMPRNYAALHRMKFDQWDKWNNSRNVDFSVLIERLCSFLILPSFIILHLSQNYTNAQQINAVSSTLYVFETNSTRMKLGPVLHGNRASEYIFAIRDDLKRCWMGAGSPLKGHKRPTEPTRSCSIHIQKATWSLLLRTTIAFFPQYLALHEV